MRQILSFLVIVVLSLFRTSLATSGHATYTLKEHVITEIDNFGFKEGGSFSFFAESDLPTNITMYLCTSKEYESLSANAQQDEFSLCYDITFTCDISASPIDLPYSNFRIPSTNLYYLLLVKCELGNSVSVEVDYHFLNPGNQELSLGFIPLPPLYISLTVIWLALILVCIVNWIINKSNVVLFHALLALVIGLKLAVVCVALCYWKLAEDSGSYIIQLKYLEGFLFAVSETAFFCALLLVAKGWRITRNNLPPVEVRSISVALVLLLSTLLFFSFYKDEYHFLSLMIMYFFMLPRIFTSITRNTRMLQTQILLLRYASVQVDSAPLLVKVRMFVMLRTAVILHLGSILMVSSMRIIMSWNHLWVNNCVSEVASLAMIAFIAWLLRPKVNGAFSPRAYLEQNPFPVLSMQNLDHDHFDDYFVDQLWDPELVLMNANAFHNAGINPFDGSCQFDSETTLVIEYPTPPSDGKTTYYPKLGLAVLEKLKKKEEEQPPEENGNETESLNPENVNEVEMNERTGSINNV